MSQSGPLSFTGGGGGGAVNSVNAGNNISITGTAGDPIVNVDGTTEHAVQVGAANGALNSLAVGTTGQGLMGSTGADPGWTGSPSFSGSVTAGTGFTATTGNVSILAGNLNLPASSSTTALINVNGTRAFSTFNTGVFLGLNAGNFVMNPSNIAIGTSALNSGTLAATGNVGIGTSALNTVAGASNLALGNSSLSTLVGGQRNIALGLSSGSAYTGSESSNILIGSSGVLGESNTIRIGTTGSGAGQVDRCFLGGITGSTITPTGMVDISSAGQLSTISTTNHAVQVGNSTGTLTSVSVGATGTVLAGSTGADPSFTATPSVTSITFGAGSALSTFTDWTSWTPTLFGSTTAGTTVYVSQIGTYSRIGNIVVVQFNLNITSTTGTGAMTIGGLPFTINNLSGYNPQGSVLVNNMTWPAGTTSLTLYGVNSTTTCLIGCSGSAVNSAFMQMFATGFIIFGTLIYRV